MFLRRQQLLEAIRKSSGNLKRWCKVMWSSQKFLKTDITYKGIFKINVYESLSREVFCLSSKNVSVNNLISLW